MGLARSLRASADDPAYYYSRGRLLNDFLWTQLGSSASITCHARSKCQCRSFQRGMEIQNKPGRMQYSMCRGWGVLGGGRTRLDTRDGSFFDLLLCRF
jgi:hypothetical protein